MHLVSPHTLLILLQRNQIPLFSRGEESTLDPFAGSILPSRALCLPNGLGDVVFAGEELSDLLSWKLLRHNQLDFQSATSNQCSVLTTGQSSAECLTMCI